MKNKKLYQFIKVQTFWAGTSRELGGWCFFEKIPQIECDLFSSGFSFRFVVEDDIGVVAEGIKELKIK